MRQQTLFELAVIEAAKKAKTNLSVQKRIQELSNELVALYTMPGSTRATIHSPTDAANLVLAEMTYLEVEEMWLICLNTRNGVTAIHKIFRGNINSSQVNVGNLFRIAILENAPAVVVLHNHPSGDPSPSPDDVGITRAIVQAGKILDVEVLDHLVIGGGRFVSLKERGLGF